MKQFVIYRAKNKVPYFVFRIDDEFYIEFYSRSIVCPIKDLYLAENKKLLYQDEAFICNCAIEYDDFFDFILAVERYLNLDFFNSHIDLFILAWKSWYYVV